MPRSNSSFGVCDGGAVVRAAVALGLRGGGGGNVPRSRGRWYWRDRAARPAARPLAPWPGRQLAAAQRPRRARRIGILASDRRRRRAGGPARWAGGRRGWFLRDRRGRRDLRIMMRPAAAAAARTGGGDTGAAATLGRAGAAGGAPPACNCRICSSSCRLRYCSSSFWPVSCRSWFSSCWIRVSGSTSSACGNDCASARVDSTHHRGERDGADNPMKSG